VECRRQPAVECRWQQGSVGCPEAGEMPPELVGFPAVGEYHLSAGCLQGAVECRRQPVVVECRRQPVVVECRRQPVVVECRRQPAVECRWQQGSVGCPEAGEMPPELAGSPAVEGCHFPR
jgi:hypothetical protein